MCSIHPQIQSKLAVCVELVISTAASADDVEKLSFKRGQEKKEFVSAVTN